MGEVINAVDKFARRTAEACVNSWDRDTTNANMKRMGAEYEQAVVRQLEQMQLELCVEDSD